MNIINKRFMVLLILIFFTIPSIVYVSIPAESSADDLDPLVDIHVTFNLLSIRSFEKDDNHLDFKEYIDRFSSPDFYVKVWINDVLFKSPTWRNQKYIYDPEWSATLDVPDTEEYVNIKIQLWDWNIGFDKICDLSSDYEGLNLQKSSQDGLHDNVDVELMYSIKTGHWFGDDYAYEYDIDNDPSGYGRLNGCDDGSYYQHERDCEMTFSITQTDYDSDTVPYWTEMNVYHTDPTVDDRGRDDDNDGVPLEWEHKWGHYIYYDWHDDTYEHAWVYDPFTYEPHHELDPDFDSINNVEEYLTADMGSDPFREDLFVEQDIMAEGPNGEKTEFPEESKELLRTAYNRRNIVYHLDDGCYGGGEIIPFDESTTQEELQDIYWEYFLHRDEDNWRRGVFHYGLVIWNAERFHGFVFWGGVGPYLDAYQNSAQHMEELSRQPWTDRSVVWASVYMHECGHTLGIFHGNTPGCDDQEGRYPWEIGWWRWRPYKSVMNYGYMYLIVDYSDGSRGKNDFDDWDRIDLTYFDTPQF